MFAIIITHLGAFKLSTKTITVSNQAQNETLKLSGKSVSALLISPSKNRRRKGEGTGLLFEKPVVRNHKKYSQWWYQWEVKIGGKWVNRTKYVPQKKLGHIKRLEKQKAPVKEILALLGVKF